MNDEQNTIHASFGSIGFGFAIILISLYFAEVLDINGLGVVLATGLFAGGLAPLIAGLWSIRTNNSFAATVYLLGATFWFSYVFTYLLPVLGVVPAISEPALAMWVQVPFFFLWGLFTFWLFLSSMKTNRVLQLFFFLLAIFFWLVALGHWFAWDTWHNSGIMNTMINIFAGWEGIVCGFVGIYYGLAQVFNDAFKRNLMPLGRVEEKP
ncbi:MAG: acetate uptake transporter [Promethearchaeota archaeon]